MATMLSTLGVHGGGSTCRLSTLTPVTGLAPSPVPPHHSVVISVDLLEELALPPPHPVPPSHILLVTTKTSRGAAKTAYGHSRALQKHSPSCLLLDDEAYRRGQLRSRSVKRGEERGGQERKSFCVMGNSGTTVRDSTSTPPLPLTIKLDRRPLPSESRTLSTTAGTCSKLPSTAHFTGSTGQSRSKRRKERLCDRGAQVRDIEGFETVSCKLHDTYHKYNSPFDNSILPVSCREADFLEVQDDPDHSADDVIRIPTGTERRETRHRERGCRLAARSLSESRHRSTQRYPVPPRGFPAPKRFVKTWLDAGCGGTKFSERLQGAAEPPALRQRNERVALWMRAANRIRLMPPQGLNRRHGRPSGHDSGDDSRGVE